MTLAALTVHERVEKPQALRRKGFIPAAIFGDGIQNGISVKLDGTQFTRLLKNHVDNAKVQVDLGSTSRLCLVKEVQRDPVTGSILHVDFQAVSENEEIRLRVPIHYEGVSAIEARKLTLLPNLIEIEVEGRFSVLPETANVDVSRKNAGDKIFARELKLDSSIRLHIDANSILAVVSAPRETVAEPVDATGTLH